MNAEIARVLDAVYRDKYSDAVLRTTLYRQRKRVAAMSSDSPKHAAAVAVLAALEREQQRRKAS